MGLIRELITGGQKGPFPRELEAEIQELELTIRRGLISCVIALLVAGALLVLIWLGVM